MLKYIDQVCREYNIEYSLIGGSLLGAIRHKGFIPWDDDIDIMLTRPNYEMLMQVLMAKQEGNYSLYYYKSMPAYFPYAKLYDNRTLIESKYSRLVRGTGVFMDIFPYDIIPNNEQEYQAFRKKIFIETRKLASSASKGIDYASGPDLKNFLFALVAYLPWHIRYRGKYYKMATEMDRLMTKYNSTQNKEIAFTSSRYGSKERFSRDIFSKYENVFFEGLEVRKIQDHNAYLHQLFGDYMKLPPESERTNHSYYKFYWKK